VFQKLGSIVDPWAYRARLTLPKLILTAAGDEFFLPDSPRFFIQGLVGETHLTTIPDAEHSLITAYVDVGETLCAFYNSILYEIPRPQYNYSLVYGNESASITVTVDPSTPPDAVKLWYANTLKASPYRDFRLVRCTNIEFCIQPIIWKDIDLTPSAPNTYSFTMKAPEAGWTGFLIELTYYYSEPTNQVLKMSTTVNVVPEAMPFPPCGDHCQPTATSPDKWGIYH
jgi:PhoPQ-activated pathogenicity-related protein